MTTIYHGERIEGGKAVVTKVRDGHPRAPLDLRLDLVNRSPTGFEWGYGGSGPAQLALALLAGVSDDATAVRHYQEFERCFVAKLKYKGFKVDDVSIRAWVRCREDAATPEPGIGLKVLDDG